MMPSVIFVLMAVKKKNIWQKSKRLCSCSHVDSHTNNGGDSFGSGFSFGTNEHEDTDISHG